jgi:hypothetical protein
MEEFFEKYVTGFAIQKTNINKNISFTFYNLGAKRIKDSTNTPSEKTEEYSFNDLIFSIAKTDLKDSTIINSWFSVKSPMPEPVEKQSTTAQQDNVEEGKKDDDFVFKPITAEDLEELKKSSKTKRTIKNYLSNVDTEDLLELLEKNKISLSDLEQAISENEVITFCAKNKDLKQFIELIQKYSTKNLSENNFLDKYSESESSNKEKTKDAIQVSPEQVRKEIEEKVKDWFDKLGVPIENMPENIIDLYNMGFLEFIETCCSKQELDTLYKEMIDIGMIDSNVGITEARIILSEMFKNYAVFRSKNPKLSQSSAFNIVFNKYNKLKKNSSYIKDIIESLYNLNMIKPAIPKPKIFSFKSKAEKSIEQAIHLHKLLDKNIKNINSIKYKDLFNDGYEKLKMYYEEYQKLKKFPDKKEEAIKAMLNTIYTYKSLEELHNQYNIDLNNTKVRGKNNKVVSSTRKLDSLVLDSRVYSASLLYQINKCK